MPASPPTSATPTVPEAAASTTRTSRSSSVARPTREGITQTLCHAGATGIGPRTAGTIGPNKGAGAARTVGGTLSPTTDLLFAAASLGLVLIPGPNHLYITAGGLAQGRAAGLASAFGVEAGTLVHIAAAAAGLSYVISRSATLFAVVKWAGVAYLGYLAFRAFTSKEDETAQEPPRQPLRQVFLEGVLVN